MKKFSPLKLGIIFFLAASSLVGCMPGPSDYVSGSDNPEPLEEPDCNGFRFGGLEINLYGDARCTDDYQIEIAEEGEVRLSGQGWSQKKSIKIFTPTGLIVIQLTGTEVYVRVRADFNYVVVVDGSIELGFLGEVETLEAGQVIKNTHSDTIRFPINSDQDAHIRKRLSELDCDRNPECLKALPKWRSGE